MAEMQEAKCKDTSRPYTSYIYECAICKKEVSGYSKSRVRGRVLCNQCHRNENNRKTTIKVNAKEKEIRMKALKTMMPWKTT